MIRQSLHLLNTFSDLAVRISPFTKKRLKYKFAFIVHPRSYRDIERKFPFFKYFPEALVEKFTKYFWPIILSKVTGLKSIKDGKDIEGYVISILPTAHQMIENRPVALRRIIQACVLAEKKGAHIVGLGGLTSSLTKGGLDIVGRVNISITTGHAYTSYNVAQNVIALVNFMGMNRGSVSVGVVGAAGSIGSTSAKLLAKEGFKNFLLVDLERKKTHCHDLIAEILTLESSAKISLSHQIQDIRKCDIIIAATNAPEALIKSVDLKWGAIVVDDAQPSDVHEDVFLRTDVLVVEAGVTHTPGVDTHFNFGLKRKEDNFCCLAELLILSAHEWEGHYVINRASIDLVEKIVDLGKELDFKIGKFQNFKESITDEKLLFVKKCITEHEH